MICFFVFPSNGAPVEWKWQGKTEVLGEKTCPSATLSTTNPTWTDPGSNPDLRGGRPATNLLNHDTAYFIYLFQVYLATSSLSKNMCHCPVAWAVNCVLDVEAWGCVLIGSRPYFPSICLEWQTLLRIRIWLLVRGLKQGHTDIHNTVHSCGHFTAAFGFFTEANCLIDVVLYRYCKAICSKYICKVYTF